VQQYLPSLEVADAPADQVSATASNNDFVEIYCNSKKPAS